MKKKSVKKKSTESLQEDSPIDKRQPKYRLASILNKDFYFSMPESEVEDIFRHRYWWLNLVPQLRVGKYRIDYYSKILNQPIEVNSFYHTVAGDCKKYDYITSQIDPFTKKNFILPIIIMDSDLRSEKSLQVWDSFFIKKVDRINPKLLTVIKDFK